jgi:hypothetical protein
MVALAIPSSAVLAEPLLPDFEADQLFVLWDKDNVDIFDDATDSWGGAGYDFGEEGMDLVLTASNATTGTTSVSSDVAIGPAWDRGPDERVFGRARVDSSLTYYFNIVGPEDVDVPIVVEGFSDFSNLSPLDYNFSLVGTAAGASASGTTWGRPEYDNLSFGCSNFDPCGGEPFSFEFSARGSDVGKIDHWLDDLTYNGAIHLFSQIEVEHLGSSYPPPASFGNILSAYVHIEENFLAQNPQFNLQFFGVANQPLMSAVPEPATWAMLLGGFGAVGGAMRRRKAVLRPRTS